MAEGRLLRDRLATASQQAHFIASLAQARNDLVDLFFAAHLKTQFDQRRPYRGATKRALMNDVDDVAVELSHHSRQFRKRTRHVGDFEPQTHEAMRADESALQYR